MEGGKGVNVIDWWVVVTSWACLGLVGETTSLNLSSLIREDKGWLSAPQGCSA
jgi:hypothetical protein